MIKPGITSLLLALFLLIALGGCEKHYALTDGDKTKGYDGIKEDDDDYTGSSTDTVFIAFNSSSVASTDKSKAIVAGTTVTIIKGGTYCISGATSNGQVVVNSADKADVRLVLKRANITCWNSSAIYIKDALKVIIVTFSGTKNYLADGSFYSYDDEINKEPDACIFSKSDLTFYGTGSLFVTGNFMNGISGKDGLIIKSGTINVTSKSTAVRGRDYILVYDGDITVKSTGDGFKSTNNVDKGAGFIWLKGGIFKLTSAADAISAYSNVIIDYANLTINSGGGSGSIATPQGYQGTVSAKGIKSKSGIEVNDGVLLINSADKAVSCDSAFVMNGGSMNISTMDDAVHAEFSLTVNGGTLNVVKAHSGFEGPAINLTAGDVTLAVTDDAINGSMGYATEYNDGSTVSVSGGNLVLSSLTGDALASNGSATISGGTVVIDGPLAAPYRTIKVVGNLNINGGILIGSGPDAGSIPGGSGSSSSQCSLFIEGISAVFTTSSFIHIQDADGADLVTFKPAKNASLVIFSSPKLASGKTYSIYTGGTYSVSTNKGGYYYGGSYSGGTLKSTFTLASKTTTITL